MLRGIVGNLLENIFFVKNKNNDQYSGLHVEIGPCAESLIERRCQSSEWEDVVPVCVKAVVWSSDASRNVYNSYLPGRGDTMIKKVVHPGRGSAIALRLC